MSYHTGSTTTTTATTTSANAPAQSLTYTTQGETKTAPLGYHYMPDGSLMSDVKHIETYGFPYRLVIKEGQTLAVNSLWVNFQRQTEFNPMHDHAGVYSFVIWMQIPTSFEEQRKLPIAINSNASTQISNFAFTYTDILGNICSFIYNMEKQAEGFMVLFPASLHHLVNPFYNNDGERISISGNISVV